MFALKAIAFHLVLAALAVFTVPELFTFQPPALLSTIGSVLYYVAIPVSTQFPDLVFFSPGLVRRGLAGGTMTRLGLGLRALAFWAFIGVVLATLVVTGNSEIASQRAFARWMLMLGLIVLLSATDYAVPSYSRYLRLRQQGSWGPAARVMLRHS